MSQEELKRTIRLTIRQLNNIKQFSAAVVDVLDRENSADAIQLLYDKVKQSESFVKDKLPQIMDRAKLICKPRGLDSHRLALLKSQAPTLLLGQRTERYFNMMASEMNLPTLPRSLKPVPRLNQMVVSFREKHQSTCAFEIKERNDCSYLRVAMLYGIEAILKVREGVVLGTVLKTKRESSIVSQIKVVLEVKLEELIEIEEGQAHPVLRQFLEHHDRFKQVFTQKCRACQLHLSFRSGVPMVPLIIQFQNYFHVECLAQA